MTEAQTPIRQWRSWFIGVHLRKRKDKRCFALTGITPDGGAASRGWKNVGDDEASISMPSELYDHDGPDRWELVWDSDAARTIIPYRLQ
jgi:hypothetical protein